MPPLLVCWASIRQAAKEVCSTVQVHLQLRLVYNNFSIGYSGLNMLILT